MATVTEIVGRDVGTFDRLSLGFTIIPRAQDALMPGEEPLRAAVGQLQGSRKFALVLLTDQRVLVARGGLTMGFEDLPLDQITSVHTSLTKLVIATGGRHEVDIRAISNVDAVAAAIREAMGQRYPPSRSTATTTPTTTSDPYDQLRKLGELKDAGVITDEEFAEKKAKLLAEL